MRLKQLLLCAGLTAAVGFVSAPAMAYVTFETTGEQFDIDGISYKVLTDGTVIAYDGWADLTEIEIPASVSNDGVDYVVSGIDSWGFCYSGYEKIHLPETIKIIGDNAFCGASATEINIPSSVEIIDDSAFAYGSLENVVIPEGVTTIGTYCFNMSTNLKSIKFPSTVKVIPMSCCDSCTALESIELSEGVEEIGIYAFVNDAAVTQLTIPSSVKRIMQQAFENLTLESLTIPANVEYLGISAFGFNNFMPMTKLTIEDSDTPLQIESYPLSFMADEVYIGRNFTQPLGFDEKYVKRITTGGGLTRIEGFTWGMDNLEELNLHEGLESIGVKTFDYSPKLTTLTIPGTVTQIEKYGLSDMPALESLTFADGVEPLNFLETPLAGVMPTKIYVGRVFEGDTSTLDASKCQEVTFGAGLEEIPSTYFNTSTDITSVTSLASMPPAMKKSSFLPQVYKDAVLYTDAVSTADYCADVVWSLFDNIYGAQCIVYVEHNDGGIVEINGDSALDVFIARNTAPVLTVILDEGYELKEIMLDDEILDVDLTATEFELPVLRNNATVKVTFDKANGISRTVADSFSVKVSGRTLGVTAEGNVTIAATDGKLIYSGVAADVEVPAPGIYMVNAGGKTLKVAVK